MSEKQDTANTEVVPPRKVRSRLASVADATITRVALRFSEVGKDIRMLARDLENTVLPEERAKREEGSPAHPGLAPRQEKLRLEIDGDYLESFPALADFLSSVGIRTIVCDLDLHYDQIQSVLHSVWMIRRHLRDESGHAGTDPLGRRRLAEAYTGEKRVHMACTEPYIDVEKGELWIVNSYCTLTFSRAVNTFMARFSSFNDHRAFFRAAPRYAVLVAAVFLVPTAGSLWMGLGTTAALVVEAIMACVVGMAVFLLFQTVGAIQYDKEHQSRLLAEKHEELQQAHAHITRDMERAARVQQGLIPGPDEQPAPDNVRVAHSFVPQMQVGGDYYDYKRLEDGRLVFLFVDVSGHGMAGAFLTGVIKTIFEIAPGKEDTVSFVQLVNDMLIRFTPPDSFAALIYGVYDPSSHVLQYVNAGHQPTPMVVRAEDGSVEHPDQAGGLAAGFVAETPYTKSEIELKPGDRLVLCTDGITERRNEDGELFGLERLKNLLIRVQNEPIEGLPEAILERVTEHRGDRPQTDDETIFAMEVVA